MKSTNRYLEALPNSHQAALIVADSPRELSALADSLRQCGLIEAQDWLTAAEELQSGRSVFLALAGGTPEELDDLLIQYERRGGMLQIVDRASLQLFEYHYDPRFVSLVIISTKDEWLAQPRQTSLARRLGSMISAKEFICLQ